MSNGLEIPSDTIYVVDRNTTLHKDRMVSTEYIEKCIEAGKLLPIDEWRVRGPRPAVQLADPKSRNNYTEAEDELLLRLVKEKEQLGMGVNGNNLYSAIADQFPRHSAQSLRERYRRVLATKKHLQPVADQTIDRAPNSCVEHQTQELLTQAEAQIDMSMDADDILMDNLLSAQAEQEDPRISSLKEHIQELQAKFPQYCRQIIFYALYVSSGDFEEAEKFLGDEQSKPCWSVLDDELLVVENDIETLKERHPIDKIRQRCEFLGEFYKSSR